MLNDKNSNDIPSRIKLFGRLLHFSNLTTFLTFLPSNPFHPLRYIFLPIVLFTFFLIQDFTKGKNWARTWLLIGIASNFVGIPLFFAVYGIDVIMTFVAIFDAVLGVTLFIFLKRNDVKAYFKKDLSSQKVSKVKGRLIALGVVVALIVGTVLAIVGMAAYYSKKGGQMDVWLENLTTHEATQLTKKGANTSAKFSNDGKKILLVHSDNGSEDEQPSSVIQIDLDNMAETEEINEGEFIRSPIWSKDDRSILYIAKKDRAYDIYVFDLQSKNTKKLTEDGLFKRDLSISPDGKWLAFCQRVKENSQNDAQEIFIMPSTGGEKKMFTHSTNFMDEPEHFLWLSDSKSVMYDAATKLIIADMDGNKIDEIDLLRYQLNTVSELLPNPNDDESFLIKARPSPFTFDFNIFYFSIKAKELKLFRKTSLSEIGHDLSPDGAKLIYSKPRET